MAQDIEVSVIIPTHNRCTLVLRAVRSVLQQSHPVGEIIVVDDGSTDGTVPALQAAFGDRVCCVQQPNGGVSVARNHGLRLARGRFLALLDSDDEWMPHKTARQLQWLHAHPDIDMVLGAYIWKDAQHRDLHAHYRRSELPEDGAVLKWVLAHPALTPSTVLMRRSVYDTVGGFDEALVTAEDLDFHIRVAARCRIGLVDEPLARLMRGQQGLSNLRRSYDDALAVVQAAVARGTLPLPQCDVDHALALAWTRAARGKVLSGHWRQALAMARRAWRLAPSGAVRRKLLALLPLAARRVASSRQHRWEL
jgi:hypothetical protein